MKKGNPYGYFSCTNDPNDLPPVFEASTPVTTDAQVKHLIACLKVKEAKIKDLEARLAIQSSLNDIENVRVERQLSVLEEIHSDMQVRKANLIRKELGLEARDRVQAGSSRAVSENSKKYLRRLDSANQQNWFARCLSMLLRPFRRARNKGELPRRLPHGEEERFSDAAGL